MQCTHIFVCTLWLNHFPPPSITSFFISSNFLQNFAEKIFHLTLFPLPLFSFHELYISSPGENSETPFPPISFGFRKFSTSFFQKRARWLRSSWTMPRQLHRRSVFCSNQQVKGSQSENYAKFKMQNAKLCKMQRHLHTQEKCVLQ